MTLGDYAKDDPELRHALDDLAKKAAIQEERRRFFKEHVANLAKLLEIDPD